MDRWGNPIGKMTPGAVFTVPASIPPNLSRKDFNNICASSGFKNYQELIRLYELASKNPRVSVLLHGREQAYAVLLPMAQEFSHLDELEKLLRQFDDITAFDLAMIKEVDRQERLYKARKLQAEWALQRALKQADDAAQLLLLNQDEFEYNPNHPRTLQANRRRHKRIAQMNKSRAYMKKAKIMGGNNFYWSAGTLDATQFPYVSSDWDGKMPQWAKEENSAKKQASANAIFAAKAATPFIPVAYSQEQRNLDNSIRAMQLNEQVKQLAQRHALPPPPQLMPALPPIPEDDFVSSRKRESATTKTGKKMRNTLWEVITTEDPDYKKSLINESEL